MFSTLHHTENMEEKQNSILVKELHAILLLKHIKCQITKRIIHQQVVASKGQDISHTFTNLVTINSQEIETLIFGPRSLPSTRSCAPQ